MYVMAALEPGRTSVQIIHEHDPCCFHGFGRHERIIAYNEWVATQVSHVCGWYCHLDAPRYISSEIIHTKYNEGCLNYSTAHA
jgi:hypothetical protein